MADAPTNPPERPGDRNAIVVFCLPKLGDTVIGHSLIRMIRERFPQAPIDIVARSPGVEVAPLMPEVRAGLTERSTAGRLTLSNRMSLVKTLRTRNYLRAYVISRSWKAALIPALAGIPERVGWFGEGRVGLINRMRFGDKSLLPGGTRMCSLALEPGETLPAEWPAPRLVMPDAPMVDWRARNPDLDDGRPALAIAPGSADTRRDWPLERFIAVARHFDARGWRVLALGGAGQQAMCEAIREACGPLARAQAHNGVMDMACAIRSATLFVGNDSGPNHLAAGLGLPTVGIFGPGFEPPINRNALVLTSPKPKSAWTPEDWPSIAAVIAGLERQETRYAPGAAARA